MFVFSGRANYWPAIGQELYATEPVYRATVQHCAQLLAEWGEGDLISRFEQSASTQPAGEHNVTYALVIHQLALTDWWHAQGIGAEACLGVSLGEFAAVYACGGLTLADALRLSVSYEHVKQAERQAYATLFLAAPSAVVRQFVAEFPTELYLLIAEHDRGFVMCTPGRADYFISELAARGTTSVVVKVDSIPPFHTARMAQHVRLMRRVIQDIVPQPLTHPCYLTTLGRAVAPGAVLGIDHWLQVLQYPVRPMETLAAAILDGYNVFTPVGIEPFPMTSPRTLRAVLGSAHLLPHMRPEASEVAVLQQVRQRHAALGLKPVPAPIQPRPLPLADVLSRLTMHTPDFVADPHPLFAYLRQQGPLHFLPARQSWLVLDTDLIDGILRQPLVYSNAPYSDFESELVGADPPRHAATRALLQRFFSGPKLRGVGDLVQHEAAALAARLREQPAFDVVADFTAPLIQAVAAQLLGLRAHEQATVVAGHSTTSPTDYAGLYQAFTHLLAAPEAGAPDTLLRHLQELVRAEALPLAHASNLLKMLWVASTVSSTTLLAQEILYLLRTPGLPDLLRQKPDQIAAFVEEVLRLEAPVSLVWRVTTQPVTLAGHSLPTGSRLELALVAANRDPARFPQPDELDLSRPASRHFAFGGSIHHCLGAQLARLEGQALVQWLLYTPDFPRPADASRIPDYQSIEHMRLLSAYPLTFSAPTHT